MRVLIGDAHALCRRPCSPYIRRTSRRSGPSVSRIRRATWQQTLAASFMCLAAVVIGTSPAYASGRHDPKRITSVTVGNLPIGVAMATVKHHETFAFVANNGDGTVSVINTKTRQVVSNPAITVGTSPAPVVAATNGQLVYVGTGEQIAVLDTATFEVVKYLGNGAEGEGSLAISPDGHVLYADPGGSGPVTVFDAGSGQIITQFHPNNGNAGALAVSPDGQRLYVGIFTNPFFVDIFDTKTLDQLAAIPVKLNPLAVTVSPDGQRLYVANWGDFSNPFQPPIIGNTVQVFNTSTLKQVGIVTVGNSPAAIALTPDGRLAYVVNQNQAGSVSVVRTADLRVVDTVPVGGTCPSGVAVVPGEGEGHDVYVTVTGAPCGRPLDTVAVLKAEP